MRLTKLTSYALRILIHCGQHPDATVRSALIAEEYRITEANVFKAVKLLVRAKLLLTVRGPGGGLRLARPPSEIRIGEVIRATEQTRLRAECFGEGGDDCVVQMATPINRVLDSAFTAFVDVLDNHTLEEFITARPGMPAVKAPPRRPAPETIAKSPEPVR